MPMQTIPIHQRKFSNHRDNRMLRFGVASLFIAFIMLAGLGTSKFFPIVFTGDNEVVQSSNDE